ncbi:LysE family translocator [Chromobacterium phragmitis]|uniref:LysE family translocator n=1 Tax=Chromobacterium phragmitis TaxID=2202141 RepID=A0A344UFA4_9NEIS|nr:LysE family translocator [Chromobacterium phragmitis]AXE28628.1 LysE family translocator [Chromobacterium phragmitis]AXE33952.1 LysE family translocator [Chromobacterium phragmitis]
MLPLSVLSLYLAALVAVYVLPGPDMALVMATSAGRGIRAGLQTALGIAASRFLHVMMSGLGLAALMATHPLLFDAVRWIGAGYLLWLAWKVIRAQPAPDGGPVATESGRAAIARGFLTNLLNPKALMFCALFLPQFVSPAHGAMLPQFMLLAGILVSVGLCFDAVYAFAACGIARRLKGRRPMARLQKGLLGGVFVAMAGRLILG